MADTGNAISERNKVCHFNLSVSMYYGTLDVAGDPVCGEELGGMEFG